MSASTPSLHERALGAYLGFAIGDALGATVEFMTKQEIAGTYGVHRNIIGGGWLRLRPGRVTDDTQMCLALGEAILSHENWETKHAADAYVRWMRTCPPDIGNTCRRGIRRYMLDGTVAATPSDDSAGNGAAMRNLPIILCALGEPAAMERLSIEQAHITHNHPLSDAATLTLAKMTRALIAAGDYAGCMRYARELVEDHPKFRFKPWPGNTSGYIVDTLQTVLDVINRPDGFENCLIDAVNRGGDADTIGALVGQLAGALYGVQDIPPRWLRSLDPIVSIQIREQTDRLVARSCRDIRLLSA